MAGPRRRPAPALHVDDPVAAGLLAVVVGGFVAMAWRWRWTHDDGFITFRVVDQVFAGNGPVYNAGERVEAFTSPLHVGLLIVLRALFGWALDEAWLSLLLTLGAAAGGLVAAVAGARALARAGGAKGTMVPFAVLVPAALPPMWEYATAGLETGLAIGWVGLSFWLLARLAARQRPLDQAEAQGRRRRVADRTLLATAVVVGLGPLVRPECTLLSLGFVVALCTFRAARSIATWRLVAAAVALPLAYEAFRMAYYAALVPNTALAKAAVGSRWGQGWYYLVNTVGPYGLVVPVAAVGTWALAARRRGLRRVFGGTDGRTLVLATVAAALGYGAYVVRIGGDYMHARMVPLFALCCPLAVVALPRDAARRGIVVGATIVMGGWALVTALALRAPAPEGFFGGHSIAEQRPFYVALSGADHPVTLSSWSRSPTYGVGDEARRAAEAGEDVLITAVSFGDVDWPRRTSVEAGAGTSLFVDGIGVAGARAGLDVHVIDLHGLAHPLASRMPLLEPRGLPGHERALPLSWALAEAGYRDPDPQSDAYLARLARRCPPAADVLDAVRGPLGPGDLLANVLAAPRLTLLDVPDDPGVAVSGCGAVADEADVGGS
ncbi:MAG TPA: hypothetical protein P5254_14385 [Aquihabitans sp.]|nr:hypothetical protein [Aquihabitans sp.]